MTYLLDSQPESNDVSQPKCTGVKYTVTNKIGGGGHNVRDKPSFNGTKLRTLWQGNEVMVYEVQGDWLRIGANEWSLSKANGVTYLIKCS